MTKRAQVLYVIILAQALVALIGSLIFSNALGYAPCDLCWYQRICMYPQLVIAGIALFRKDVQAFWYGLPLALVGLGIAVFHTTIYMLANYTKATVEIQCSVNGVSCTSRYIELLGFLSIPLLSLLAFVVTVVCYFLLIKETKK